jgi:hypothetical protein
MGKIKSALEIALEKTESVKSDKGSIGQFEAKQNGKKLANQYLEGTVKSLQEEIKKSPPGERESFRQGVFDVLISQITLPLLKDDIKRIEAASQGLSAVIESKRFAEISKQFVQIMNQFLEEAGHFEEAIKKQYAPKLRQKEEELSRRTGQKIKLDPFQDPEFVAYYNQNIQVLKANYQAAADQVREEAQNLFKAS